MLYLIIFCVVPLLAVIAALTWGIVRAARLLLQYDQIFADIIPELESYSEDLRKLSSGGLLLDHPEVINFHRRNIRALRTLESIVDSVKKTQPLKKKPAGLPRPVVV